MPSRRVAPSNQAGSARPPATTPDDRENQLVAAAVDLAEQQLREGSASAQVITHYLKLGSSRERLEQERLRSENRLLVTKQEMMESEKRVEGLYIKMLDAMRQYSGNAPAIEASEYDDYPD